MTENSDIAIKLMLFTFQCGGEADFVTGIAIRISAPKQAGEFFGGLVTKAVVYRLASGNNECGWQAIWMICFHPGEEL